jgi:hypothetical protein
VSFFFDGTDPEYDEELVLNQNITELLNFRDVCLLMRHSRLNAQSAIGGGYEYNQLQLEIWFIEKIIRVLDKALIHKFNIKNDNQQFFSLTLSNDLGLTRLFPVNILISQRHGKIGTKLLNSLKHYLQILIEPSTMIGNSYRIFNLHIIPT